MFHRSYKTLVGAAETLNLGQSALSDPWLGSLPSCLDSWHTGTKTDYFGLDCTKIRLLFDLNWRVLALLPVQEVCAQRLMFCPQESLFCLIVYLIFFSHFHHPPDSFLFLFLATQHSVFPQNFPCSACPLLAAV